MNKNIFNFRTMRISIILTILVLFFPNVSSINAISENPVEVGIEEKLGNFVSLDLTFNDENGKPVKLKELVNSPTVLSLVYYRCPAICSPLLAGISDVVSRMQMDPLKDYIVVTISIDPKEQSSLAAEKKANYFKAMNRPFPE